MKFHIVQIGETLDKILFLYDLNRDELVEENRHIKNWNKLIPGTKLKIPTVSQTIDSEIMEMEPFVEDYYPKISSEIEEESEENEEKIVYQSAEGNDVFEENKEIKEVIIEKNEEEKEVRSHSNETKIVEEKSAVDKKCIMDKVDKPKYQYYRYYYINPRPTYIYPIYYYPIYYPIIKK